MKKYYITLKREYSLKDALEIHLPGNQDVNTIIESGGVWLNNGRIFDQERLLYENETLTVFTSSDQGKKYLLPPEHIVFANRDLLAVHKPPNLNVQADYATTQFNLTYGVNDYLGGNYENTAVTRLDYQVQGLVLFPKHKTAEKELFRLSREGKIKKQYIAMLESKQSPKCMRIRDTLGFARKAIISKKGKNAHSLFMLKEKRRQSNIYSVFIFTGRRHQIRFHAARYIAPVIGDRLYGSSVTVKNSGIGLIACGYNVPYKGKHFRIRLEDVNARIKEIEGCIK